MTHWGILLALDPHDHTYEPELGRRCHCNVERMSKIHGSVSDTEWKREKMFHSMSVKVAQGYQMLGDGRKGGFVR